ncbi:hypothetical protein GUJ93_ZPchr0013g36313 [Zizania palustris]|uniref:Uncharacterized protein n=1 Tax=Zizania palustris TaxID=103762 RepID=A0A8J6C0F8_ZIZPA|nr:hypothetical protein GUJ93_ZPchr0013g36313 [Zizania palustris]
MLAMRCRTRTPSPPVPRPGNINPIAMSPSQHFSLTASATVEPHAEMMQFSFLQNHFMPRRCVGGLRPSQRLHLNFSMSSGLVGVHSRETLQSNSQSHLSSHHHHQQHQLQRQRLSIRLDAPSNIPSLFTPSAGPTATESQFVTVATLHLWGQALIRSCSKSNASLSWMGHCLRPHLRS